MLLTGKRTKLRWLIRYDDDDDDDDDNDDDDQDNDGDIVNCILKNFERNLY